jgi:hypothetical protein
MADWEPLYIDVTPPGVLETLDAVRREHQIEVEGTILQLHEILPSENLRGLGLRQREAERAQTSHQRSAVRG